MAKKKLPSPTDDEIERIAESIASLDVEDEIQDLDTFDSFYDDYFGEEKQMLRNETVRKQVFNAMRRERPNIVNRRLFSEAKGKDLNADKKRTSKEVVTSRRKYKQKGASRVDLKGYDTKSVRASRDLHVVGRVRGKVVFSSRELVKVKGKPQVRHRDRFGRFVSVRK